MSELEIIENESQEQKVKRIEGALEFANQKLAFFELNGIAKLYFALNRIHPNLLSQNLLSDE